MKLTEYILDLLFTQMWPIQESYAVQQHCHVHLEDRFKKGGRANRHLFFLVENNFLCGVTRTVAGQMHDVES